MFKQGEKVFLRGHPNVMVVLKVLDGGKLRVRQARRSRFEGWNFYEVPADELTAYHASAAFAAKLAKAKDARTCQICGRPIHAAKGLIAHHGYQRPSWAPGNQTASCLGARFRPFEVCCERLRWYLDVVVAGWIVAAEELVAAYNVAGCRVPGPLVPKLDEQGRKQIDRRTGRTIRWQPLVGPEHPEYAKSLAMAQYDAARDLEHTERHRADQARRLAEWKPAGAV